MLNWKSRNASLHQITPKFCVGRKRKTKNVLKLIKGLTLGEPTWLWEEGLGLRAQSTRARKAGSEGRASELWKPGCLPSLPPFHVPPLQLYMWGSQNSSKGIGAFIITNHKPHMRIKICTTQISVYYFIWGSLSFGLTSGKIHLAYLWSVLSISYDWHH